MGRSAEPCAPLQTGDGRRIPSGVSCGPDCHPQVGATGPTLLLLSMLQSSRPPDFPVCAVEVCFYSHKWSLGNGFVVFDTSIQWKALMQHHASLFYSTSLFSFVILRKTPTSSPVCGYSVFQWEDGGLFPPLSFS